MTTHEQPATVRIVTVTPLSGRVVLWAGPNSKTAVKRYNQLSSRYAARGLRVWIERGD